MATPAPTSWTVRRLGPGDEDLLGAAIALDEKTQATSIPEKQRRALADPNAVHLVVHRGNQVLGYCYGYGMTRADRPADMLLLFSVDVRPDARRQGLGHALTQAFLDEATARDARVWLATNAFNTAAMALYAKAGAIRTAKDDVILSFEPRPEA